MNEMDADDFEQRDNDLYGSDFEDAVRYTLKPILKEREQDKHPPYYPFNTFAPRDNNCQTCHAKVVGAGWYFRFLCVQGNNFFCQNCWEEAWKGFINRLDTGKRGIAIHGALSEKIGNEIIKMLQGKALTN